MLDLFHIVFICFVGIYLYFDRKYLYWRIQHLPHYEPKFSFGNFTTPTKALMNATESVHKHYTYFKSQRQIHCGLWFGLRPVYMPIDPQTIKLIMVQDFNYFSDHGIYHNKKVDPLGYNLLTMEGQNWKYMRDKVAPLLTSNKIKMMFPIMVNCSDQMMTKVTKLSESSPVDVKDILDCFTLDVIGCCAFGLNLNSFSDVKNEFKEYTQKLFAPARKCWLVTWLSTPCYTKLLNILRLSLIPSEISRFFLNSVEETINFRESTKFHRSDLMQSLIDSKNQRYDTTPHQEGMDGTRNLTVEEIAAQAFICLFAGFQTSANTLKFCLYELAQNLDIQEKSRKEVMEVISKSDGQITYDNVNEMKYLGQVVDETLRKYPPVSIIPKICTKDYEVPDSFTTIPRGTIVAIPVMELHRDPEYFPNPEKFDPERFNENNRVKIRPFTYIPFGMGPRTCIATQFGLTQMKVGLAVLLKNCMFTLNEKTPLSLSFDKKSFILSFEDKIWLNVKCFDE